MKVATFSNNGGGVSSTVLTMFSIIVSLISIHSCTGQQENGSLSSSPGFEIFNMNGCPTLIHNFNPLQHKAKYIVGVYSSEGEQVVFDLYGTVFKDYLTATVGQQFNPPIEFDLVPVTLTKLMDMADSKKVDFFFSSSAIMSCMATEQESQPLVTIVNRRESRGHSYELDVYGGVMMTLATNTKINTIEDFKDKRIGAGGITAMGGGQTQFYEMVKAGLSFVADPKQVVFTNDELHTIQGLIDGDYDIAFVRTDQIERHVDPITGLGLDPAAYKVINPQVHTLEDGKLFPFVSSTGLHPEWPVAALKHVSQDVVREVQEALLALKDHYTSIDINKTIRCDTTSEIAELAKKAATSGSFTAFRTARSYFEVRTKQEDAGLMLRTDDDEDGKEEWSCIRGDSIYEDVHCPVGHYKLTENQFHKSCEINGLPCKEGYTCYCRPCVQAFEVDVFQYNVKEDKSGSNNNTVAAAGAVQVQGCEKMSLCGLVEQTKHVVFRASDNRKRPNVTVEALMHFGRNTERLDVQSVHSLGGDQDNDDSFLYEFGWTNDLLGVGIMEIYFDNEQIPESPLRVQVVGRDCDEDYPGENLEPDDFGVCVCDDGTMYMWGQCVESTIIAVVISIASVILLSILGITYLRYKNRKADQVWNVNVDELHFDDPVEVIGQGSFGVVIMAEYRGTKVAIKRALKGPKGKGSRRGSISKSRNTSSVNSPGTRSTGSAEGVRSVDDSADLESAQPMSTDSLVTDDISTESHLNESDDVDDDSNLAFLAQEFGNRRVQSWFCCIKTGKRYDTKFKETILGNSASLSRTSIGARLLLCFDSQAQRRAEFKSEMRILSRLRHPCITTVMGAVVSSVREPMLVLEYMEYGSLYDLLRNETMYLSGEIILQMARDVAQGIRYLHSSKPAILHGDLKARNILVDTRFRAKLCDFGLASKQGNAISGTPYWMAPEYLRGQTQYDVQCDIYSIGITLYEVYARKSPYEGERFKEVLRKVCDRRVNKRPPIPDSCPPKMVELMKKCWSPDATFRPQARELDVTLMDMSPRDAEPLECGEDAGFNQQKRRSGDMLYELFPKHIADSLKAGQKVEPESHDLVTVVFSDIVKFTDISREISPLKVSQMLDRLYLAFDKIARKHKIFKVETIGDSYMGVTNLLSDQEGSHVKRVAEFAIEMINEASQILIDDDDPSRGFINIRVGFHSGPVVSNVIGSLNPRYGLFGDTVNTASRMESNSLRNRILCTEKAYKLLRHQAPEIGCSKRGKIHIKGKGDMNTFWVGDKLVKANRGNRGEDKTIGFADDIPQLLSPHAKRLDYTGAIQDNSCNKPEQAPPRTPLGAKQQEKKEREQDTINQPTSPDSFPRAPYFVSLDP